MGKLGRLAGIIGILTVGLAATGCKRQNRLFDHVTFRPSDNLEVVRVSLVFGKRVQSDLAGAFAIQDYGALFINPYTPAQPFEIGFELNTSIVNDQNLIDLTPTTVLPNGVPIGLPHAVVEVKAPRPIHQKFDLYGYVDVLHQSWLGVAAMFTFINDTYFPAGLAVSQMFMSDSDGRPGVIATAFGPTLDSGGHLIRNGGIALFANVRQLIAQAGHGKKELVLQPAAGAVVSGPAAADFQGDWPRLILLERRVGDVLNQN